MSELSLEASWVGDIEELSSHRDPRASLSHVNCHPSGFIIVPSLLAPPYLLRGSELYVSGSGTCLLASRGPTHSSLLHLMVSPKQERSPVRPYPCQHGQAGRQIPQT